MEVFFMKVRHTIMAMALFAVAAPAFEAPASARAQQQSAGQTGVASTQQQTTPAAQRRRPRRKRPRAAAGIPTGVENCLNRLATLAAADPLIDYEGRPSNIINNGLLWNDPKSKCSVGEDQARRKQLLELANHWRTKNAEQVRSILTSMGATAEPAKQ
jgi:hypothetical protein